MFLNLFVDVVLITIIVAASCYGYKKGLFGIVARFTRTFVCLAVSISVCDPIAELIIAPILRVPIKSFFMEYIQQIPGGIVADIPTILRIFGTLFNVSYESFTVDTDIQMAVNSFSEPFVVFISKIVAFLLIFLFLKYFIRLLIYFADSFLNIGIIGWLNRLLGALISICVAFLCVTVFISVIDYFFQTDILLDSGLVRNFDGGLIYRLFKGFYLPSRY